MVKIWELYNLGFRTKTGKYCNSHINSEFDKRKFQISKKIYINIWGLAGRQCFFSLVCTYVPNYYWSRIFLFKSSYRYKKEIEGIQEEAGTRHIKKFLCQRTLIYIQFFYDFFFAVGGGPFFSLSFFTFRIDSKADIFIQNWRNFMEDIVLHNKINDDRKNEFMNFVS